MKTADDAGNKVLISQFSNNVIFLNYYNGGEINADVLYKMFQ